MNIRDQFSILERHGFIQYSLHNLWIKYKTKGDIKVPVLYITYKKSGEYIISDNNGNSISSNKEEDIENFILKELRDFKIDELLN